ncbi:MAG: hypothetical protein JOZ37_13940, partial [Actinobacteria bacterium]|nr:hypothetical protein [Actinomycetota bacterium]
MDSRRGAPAHRVLAVPLVAAFAIALAAVHRPTAATALQAPVRRPVRAREVRVLLSKPAPATTTSTAAPPSITTSTTIPLPGPPTVIDHGPTDRHAIALTFDSNLTDAMIRELDDGKVASFD